MIICDLCGEAKDCLQKELDGKEYDIWTECWNRAEKTRALKPRRFGTVYKTIRTRSCV